MNRAVLALVRADAIGKWQVLVQLIELHFAPLNNRRPVDIYTHVPADRVIHQMGPVAKSVRLSKY